MSLAKTTNENYKQAFKARDDLRVQVLRMLRAEIHGKEKEAKHEIPDVELVTIVRTMIKKRNEAAEAFRQGGATERADRELAEADFLATYLPPELDAEALSQLIAEAIDEVGAKGIKDMGAVMKAVMPKVAGRADGKTVNQKVRQALSY
ncbi:MAG: GatB/YqeY domain-containing protein [Candidatus Lernaella stagnicola]|nr:GatB/YqeY domain-containing protein [Candidatus Lernaella stagnicola]